MTEPHEKNDPTRPVASRTEGELAWLRATRGETALLALVDQRVRARRRMRHRGVGVTAVLALAVLGLAAGRWSAPRPADSAPAVLATTTPAASATISSPRREVLPDGSIIELKGAAEVSHVFDAASRRVTLLRGEAHFQVEKDLTRPFVVTAAGVAVRAVGTAFSVQLQGQNVEVLVTEGRVAVAGPAAGTSAEEPAAFLERGGLAVVRLDTAQAPEVGAVTAKELAQRLSWRVPQLEFSHTALPEIVRLMNTQNPQGRQLVIELPAREAAEIKLSGLMAADNVDGLVRLLEDNFPVRAVADSSHVRLRRRE